MLLGAVTVSVCATGAVPPTTALKAKAGAPSVSVDTVVTFKVTDTVCVPEAATMEIVPVHVIPAAIPDWLTETAKVVFVALAVKLPSDDTDNQLLLVQLCSDAWAVALVLLAAVTVRVCEAGAVPPAMALKVKAEGLSVSDPVTAAVTFKVTDTVCVPEAATMEIVPVHAVPATIPDWLTETAKLVFVELAVKLPVGDTVSQLLLAQLCSDDWAVALVLLGAVTVRVCEAGAAPPAVALKVKAEGLTVSVAVAVAVTFRVTATVCVPEAAVMEIVPVHAVPAAIPDWLAETVKLVLVELAVKVPVGDIVSQLLLVQLCSDDWAVALVLLGAVTVRVCEAGAAPLATALKVNAEALSVSVVAAVTFRVTLAVCVPVAAIMEIVPVHAVPPAIPDWFTETVKLVAVELAVKVPVGDIVSQLLLVQLCSDDWAVALVLPDAVTVRVCEAGAAPPATALKVNDDEPSVSVGDAAAVTLRETL